MAWVPCTRERWQEISVTQTLMSNTHWFSSEAGPSGQALPHLLVWGADRIPQALHEQVGRTFHPASDGSESDFWLG